MRSVKSRHEESELRIFARSEEPYYQDSISLLLGIGCLWQGTGLIICDRSKAPYYEDSISLLLDMGKFWMLL